MSTAEIPAEPKLSSRERALIRFIIGSIVAFLLTLPVYFRLAGTNDVEANDAWVEITGSFFLVLEATFHRVTDTITVNAWLVRWGIGKDDIRTPREKSRDRRKIRALKKQLREGNERLKQSDTDSAEPPDTGEPV